MIATTRRAARARRPSSTAPAALVMLLLVLVTCASGCPCVRSVVNASEGLRWWLFSNYGAQQMCPEMLKHGGVALRLQEGAPATGRFFPNQCAHRIDDANRTVTVDFSGTGYAFVAPARRIGFSSAVSVEYRPDFQLAGDDVYVWARLNRIVAGPSFQLLYAENPVVDAATSIGPVAAIANQMGNQIVSGELTRGFTVVHNEDTGNAFALGIILPPNRPTRPYDVSADDAFTFANESVQIHAEQRDYLGPFEITDEDQELVLKLSLTGPNGVDLIILHKAYGDTWRDAYLAGTDPGPPPGPVVGSFAIPPGFTTRRIKLPRGLYHVVVDNGSRVGTTSPTGSVLMNNFWSSSVQLSYVAQLVED